MDLSRAAQGGSEGEISFFFLPCVNTTINASTHFLHANTLSHDVCNDLTLATP